MVWMAWQLSFTLPESKVQTQPAVRPDAVNLYQLMQISDNHSHRERSCDGSTTQSPPRFICTMRMVLTIFGSISPNRKE